MCERKYELPRNWFKRISRRRYRGKEYFFNATTKERSWDHPLKDIARNSIAEWLHQNETGSTTDNNVPVTVNSPTVPSQCDDQCANSSTATFSSHLESEYKRFEEALAIIEKDAAIDSAIDSSSAYSPYEEHHFDTQSIQSITFPDKQAIHEVSLLRNNKASMIQRSFHLVIDTNIFLTQMTFLENLLNKINDVPGKPMLVIPYVVLQELDELKMRTKKHISVQAMHAIAFISQQLKMKPDHICGQSAMDNGIQFIDVFNANDSIINCCLQLKQNCEHVVLLTNDLSLSNKAICSHIEVYTKSELEGILSSFRKNNVNLR
ncbi:transcriptional protein swt1-like [Bradysia coprophila]|uniref:transcriptional protein swt1-like n=1 Tax=Bradysia coprophila TaxID=38358 RepID=UPI00187DA5C3|nr:transcriptional protein swt1-like [Bradysia coprophila]